MSNWRSFVRVLRVIFLSVTLALPFILVFFGRCPTLMDGLHHMPRFGGVLMHTSPAMLSGACFLSVLAGFSISPHSDVLPNKNQ